MARQFRLGVYKTVNPDFFNIKRFLAYSAYMACNVVVMLLALGPSERCVMSDGHTL